MKRIHLTAVALAATVVYFSSSRAAAGDIKGTINVTVAKTSANVVVYLTPSEGEFTVTPPDTVVVLNQQGKEFIPHVLPIIRGTTVEFRNSDDFLHNIHARYQRTTLFNWAMPMKGMKIKRKFNDAGQVMILCNVHHEMSAYIVLLDTPFFATTEKDGSFVIKNVSPGRYVLHTWHEKAKARSIIVEVSETEHSVVNLELGE